MSDPTPPEGQPVPPQYPAPPQPTYPAPPQPTYPAQPPASPDQSAYGQPYAQPTYPQQPYGGWTPPATSPDKRPGTVTAAAVITWVCCTLSVGLAGLFFVLAAVADQDFLDDIERDGDVDLGDVTLSDIQAGMVVMGIILLVWSISAIIAAVFAYRRSNGGRITLVISASVAIIPLLLGTFTVLLPGLFLIAAIATIVLLFTGGASEWYRSRNQFAPLEQGPPPGGPTYY